MRDKVHRQIKKTTGRSGHFATARRSKADTRASNMSISYGFEASAPAFKASTTQQHVPHLQVFRERSEQGVDRDGLRTVAA